MRFFDYIDTIEKPTVENIRAIYRASAQSMMIL